jgi:hypothetical protein
MVRAKLTCSYIQDRTFDYGQGGKYPTRIVRFDCSYDDKIPEDQRFQKATPSGFIEMQIDNEAALAQLQPGKSFYVDFTPVEAASPAVVTPENSTQEC